jgi:hypothetical protein
MVVGHALGIWRMANSRCPVSSSGRINQLAVLQLTMKVGSHACGLRETEFLLCKLPTRKISARCNEIISRCRFGRPTSLPRRLIVPSVIPACQGIDDLLPAITNLLTRFQRSKRRLVWEEPSESREDESRRVNISLLGRHVVGRARIHAATA